MAAHLAPGCPPGCLLVRIALRILTGAICMCGWFDSPARASWNNSFASVSLKTGAVSCADTIGDLKYKHMDALLLICLLTASIRGERVPEVIAVTCLVIAIREADVKGVGGRYRHHLNTWRRGFVPTVPLAMPSDDPDCALPNQDASQLPCVSLHTA